jgi:hypothetical protein
MFVLFKQFLGCTQLHRKANVQSVLKSKVLPVHASKVYGGSRSIAPLILNSGAGLGWTFNITPW